MGGTEIPQFLKKIFHYGQGFLKSDESFYLSGEFTKKRAVSRENITANLLILTRINSMEIFS